MLVRRPARRRSLTRRPARRSVRAGLAVGVLLVSPVLTACGGGDSGGSGDGSGSGSGSSQAGSGRTIATPTGNPFTASLTGPSLADPGQTVTAVLTNTGRLPNAFQFELEPAGAAVVTPRTVTLGPGQKVTVSIKVISSPLNVNVESASGGLGDFIATLELGASS